MGFQQRILRQFIISFAILANLLVWAAPAVGATTDCYTVLTQLRYSHFTRVVLEDNTPFIVHADGTKVPIARAFEKEGLLYRDIAQWFPSAKATAADKMRKRLEAETKGDKPANLHRWLKNYSNKYRSDKKTQPKPKKWAELSPHEQLEYILSDPDFFRLISVQGREDLFYDGILNFDDLVITKDTPEGLTVGDDLGSYEVRSEGGVVDRNKYQEGRELVEEGLEGKVGHQHKVHAWPEDPVKRQLMAPYYIELLDGGSWYLFWRQMKRNPSDVESIMSHPFLGVYTRAALLRLFEAVYSGNVKGFKNKFRMIGARNFKADPRIPEQGATGQAVVPDFELRSGNKSDNRDFVEDMIEARLASGDYSGLQDFRNYDFDPAAPIEVHAYKWLNEEEIAILKRFESEHPQMKYSRSKLSHNHLRTKAIAPLLPWDRRLNINYKKEDILWPEQQRYAKRLVEIAETYLKRMDRWRRENKGKKAQNDPRITEWREEALEDIEKSAYRFATRTRLDLDFERYLSPRPVILPDIIVPISGPIDVNEMALGIEYSFRFPAEAPITSQEMAEREIRRTLEAIKLEMGVGPIERLEFGGHGHGASVRYKYTDPQGRVWRAEWDGIQRDYIDGKLVNPHGGHMEVPSPKFFPKDARTDIQPIFEAARSNGQFPKRSAGGGHMNTDFAPLKELPPKEGPQKVKSLIGYFESNRELITFLWQHPMRSHAARRVELKPGFAQRLAKFDGDWNDLARFLYVEQYFNPYVGRKPRYVEMDLTGLMGPVVPSRYKKGTLDIKNPTQEWFPDFGTGKDRSEFRLYDAPPNEYFAALQIKYHRAILNAAFNSPQPVPLVVKYPANAKEIWRANPKEFVKAAEEHLKSLGLDPVEFRPLIQDAWEMQQTLPREKPALKRYDKFLPPENPDAATPPKQSQHFSPLLLQNWLAA